MIEVDKNTFQTEVLVEDGSSDSLVTGCVPCAALMPKVSDEFADTYGDKSVYISEHNKGSSSGNRPEDFAFRLWQFTKMEKVK